MYSYKFVQIFPWKYYTIVYIIENHLQHNGFILLGIYRNIAAMHPRARAHVTYSYERVTASHGTRKIASLLASHATLYPQAAVTILISDEPQAKTC